MSWRFGVKYQQVVAQDVGYTRLLKKMFFLNILAPLN